MAPATVSLCSTCSLSILILQTLDVVRHTGIRRSAKWGEWLPDRALDDVERVMFRGLNNMVESFDRYSDPRMSCSLTSQMITARSERV